MLARLPVHVRIAGAVHEALAFRVPQIDCARSRVDERCASVRQMPYVRVGHVDLFECRAHSRALCLAQPRLLLAHLLVAAVHRAQFLRL